VARFHGAGRDADAAAVGSQALWLGFGIGLVLAVGIVALAGPAVSLMGGRGEIAALLRGISLPGDTALCEGTHTAGSAAHLFCGSYGSEEDAT